MENLKEKQIEEMEIEKLRLLLVGVGDISKDLQKEAEKAIKAGYRKQSEGEWIQHQSYHQTDDFYCSLCGAIAPVDCLKEDFYESNFCPNCGAKMKGGAE